MERGLQILALFDEQRPSLTVKQIATLLEIPLATTYRLVKTLLEHGMLERHGSRHEVRLGLELVRLAALKRAGSDLQTVGVPVLRELVRRTSETALVLVPNNWSSICIGMVEGTSSIRPRSVRIGEEVPYNGGALPLTLLAFLDDEHRKQVLSLPFKRYTESTPCSPEEIEDRCEEIRQRGYGYSMGEYIEGTAALAAPVYAEGREGATAAVGITGVTAGVADQVTPVLDAAAEMTLRLGGYPR